MHFFSNLTNIDPAIEDLITAESQRQFNHIELIASENFTSKAVLEAQGSILTNKYAEGYPGKRYYGGCEYVDGIEQLAIERAKQLFGCSYANVQPHSGSQANQAVFLSLLEPGDTILGMALDSGGHLTHGAAPNLSGRWFKTVSYTVNPENYLIDYEQVRELAITHKPKLIICGYSAYSRQFDFAKFREIADEVNAYLLADVAHIAGLIATGYHPNPFPHAHVVTSTTHKTLRGPRGGLILANDPEIAKKLNFAIFPGLQGGPLMHVITGKAVAFLEAQQPAYKEYIRDVIENCQALSNELISNGFDILTGGTDNHLLLVDLRKQGLTGKEADAALDRAFITCNKNNIPFDTASPFVTSGIRLGTAACTTRGFKQNEFKLVAKLIAKVLKAQKLEETVRDKIVEEVKEEVATLCQKFPLY